MKTSESRQFTRSRNRLLRVLDVGMSKMKLSVDSLCGEDLFSRSDAFYMMSHSIKEQNIF